MSRNVVDERVTVADSGDIDEVALGGLPDEVQLALGRHCRGGP